jgi:hypothetical protein
MKNYLTFLALESLCRREAGISEDQVDPAARRFIVNNKMMKIYQMLDGLNDPFYDRSTALTVAADQELLKDTAVNSGIVNAIDSSAKTITRNTGTFVAGSIVSITLWTASTGVIVGEWLARITVGGATATYVKIGSGTEFTLTGSQGASLIVVKTLSTTTIDMSSFYVKDVLKVYDDAAAASAERTFRRIADPVIFGEAHRDPLYDSEVLYHQRGDDLMIFKGTSATALGNVSMQYRTKPTVYTSANETSEALIPPENNQMLIDEVVASFMQQGGKALPDSLNARLAQYSKVYEAAAAEKAKSLEARGTRAG